MVLYHAKSGHTGRQSSTGASTPVFVDSSGRRALILRRTGYGMAGLAAAYMAVLGLSLMGATPFAPQTILPVPGDAAGPAAPEQYPQGRTPSAPGDPLAPVGPGPYGRGIAGPGVLLIPQLTPNGVPPLLAPFAPGSPPMSTVPAPPATAGPEAPTAKASPSPSEQATPPPGDAPAPAPAPGTGGTPASPPPSPEPAPETSAPPAPPPPEPTAPAPQPTPQSTPPPAGSSAPSTDTSTSLPSGTSVAEVP